jgi:hypothetical protein
LVDATELIIITSLVQTIVITLTLVVFIFQFRGQEKAIRESSYQNVMGRYTDYVRMLVERPELTRLLADMGGMQIRLPGVATISFHLRTRQH